MRDVLCGKTPCRKECGVINLDKSTGPGTHHVCYWKNGKDKFYFDSFGVIPCKEMVEYLGRPIFYSTFQIQDMKDTNCSELCLHVLAEVNKGKKFKDVILNMIT